MSLKERIEAFNILSQLLKSLLNNSASKNEQEAFNKLLIDTELHNPWFDRNNIIFSLTQTAEVLSEIKLNKWLAPYKNKIDLKKPSRIAVILAGNIPLVGFHDFLCVLMSGHIFIGKLSSQDTLLLPYISNLLIKINADFKNYIFFKDFLKGEFDAVIATGSDNTSRYFDYYFSKNAHIFRKNRNSIAVLTGMETDEQLQHLAMDMCLYYGKGCRSVSKIFIPERYNFDKLITALSKYKYMLNNSKFFNNYQYYKAIYTINNIEFTDSGIILLVKNNSLNAPVSILFYDYYEDIKTVNQYIINNKAQIQCVVGSLDAVNCIAFGNTQKPELDEYADGMDTMSFLISEI